MNFSHSGAAASSSRNAVTGEVVQYVEDVLEAVDPMSRYCGSLASLDSLRSPPAKAATAALPKAIAAKAHPLQLGIQSKCTGIAPCQRLAASHSMGLYAAAFRMQRYDDDAREHIERADEEARQDLLLQDAAAHAKSAEVRYKLYQEAVHADQMRGGDSVYPGAEDEVVEVEPSADEAEAAEDVDEECMRLLEGHGDEESTPGACAARKCREYKRRQKRERKLRRLNEEESDPLLESRR
jgi:hypothetical protein